MRRVPVSYRHPTPVLSTTGEENLLSRSVSHLKKKKKKSGFSPKTRQEAKAAP